MEAKLPRIVVIGSVYIDMTLRCPQIPAVQQSISSTALTYNVTGAGANSATQAALCGCEVQLISKVGGGALAKMVKQSLAEFGVKTDYLCSTEAKNTGVIVTIVNSLGENATLNYAGANCALSTQDIESAEEIIAAADVCLIHGSMPIDAILCAINIAKLHRTKIVINPARPIKTASDLNDNTEELPLEYLVGNIVISNLYEAAEIVDHSAVNNKIAKLIGSEIITRGAEAAVITMGKKGCMVVDRETTEHVDAFDVNLVDNTGTGDAFAGAFAACCAVDDNLIQSVKFASAAGALACTKFGTIEAMSKKVDIIQLLQKEDIE